MTGFADQRERASGLNAIVHDVVTKPFSVADIRTAVADALAARKKGSGALTRHCRAYPAKPAAYRSMPRRSMDSRSSLRMTDHPTSP